VSPFYKLFLANIIMHRNYITRSRAVAGAAQNDEGPIPSPGSDVMLKDYVDAPEATPKRAYSDVVASRPPSPASSRGSEEA